MIVLTRIAEGFSQIASQVIALVKARSGKSPAFAGDLAPEKIKREWVDVVEGKNQFVV